MKIVLLHGFLGQKKDWQKVASALQLQNPALDIQVPDVWSEASPQDFKNLHIAGERLSQVITGDELTLVGYSLGGRLLLHWPIDKLWRIKKVILISVHTGLSTLVEKNERQLRDQKWAERFLKEEWSAVIADWNQQSVFSKDGVRPPRKEADFDRKDLSAALKNWSLSTQEDLKKVWNEVPFKVDYVTGEQDQKFSVHARSLKKHGTSWLFHSVPGAGHSLHLSHPQDISQILLK